jgi:SPP1 family predicted phage head-tail adaptor
MINFGKYDQRVTFRSYGDEPDGYGGTVPVANDLLTTFASVKQMKGFSNVEQAQLGLPKSYLVKILVRSEFVPSTEMSVIYRNTEYKIVGLEKVQERLNWEWVIVITGGVDLSTLENGNIPTT